MKLRRALSPVGAVLLALAAALLLGQAYAQRAPYGAEKYSEPGSSSGRNVAGKFDYYALVMSWSPTHCQETGGRRGDELQCSRRDGRRYSFVLHGLWPQYERGYPEACPIRGRNFVPRPVIDDMLDIMPAPGLVIHEYRKHGTCSGLEPRAYYGLARKLFIGIKVPEQFNNPYESQHVTGEEVESAFIKANPGMKPDMISVSCGSAKLQEIRICFSKEGDMRACGSNERRGDACNRQKLFVPPARSTKFN